MAISYRNQVALTPNARRILEMRYLKRDDDGQATEGPEDMFCRVAENIASADAFYDPDFGLIRADYSAAGGGEIIPYRFWDSDNNRLQDGRASYGAGFQFRFIGGLQFNWVWSQRVNYTQYVYTSFNEPPIPMEIDSGGTRNDFYIAFDW